MVSVLLKTKTNMKTVLSFLLLAAILSGCKENAVYEEAPVGEVAFASADASALKTAAPDRKLKDEGHSGYLSPPIPGQYEQKIIRSANLKFLTDDISKTFGIVLNAVRKNGGTVQNDREATDYESVSRTLLVRIPAKNFDTFLGEVSSGVAYFDEKEITSEDVTEEYIDIDSRIKTKKALENRYLELLKKANKVSEMLEVEAKLSEIREEVESRQARLDYLKNQVAMSSLSITFYKNTPDNAGATVSYAGKIGNALRSGVNGLSDFFIGLIEMWPFILILVALIVFFRKRWRRRKKK